MAKVVAVVAFLGLILLQGCGTTGTGELYMEPSIDRSEVNITKVAVVPNRLPMNLQDPEKWRRFNWETVTKQFQSHGIDVVDYETSVNTFKKSGLPVEDTKASRDKYAELAEQLGVDAVIIPYYGTFATMRNTIFISSGSYIGVATFQIYLKQQNDFFARVDVSGENYYTAGFGVLLGIGVGIGVASGGSSSDASSSAGISAGAMLGGTLLDLIIVLQSDDSRWKDAFESGITAGFKPFFTAIGK
jgi:hypothetical protein